MTSALRRHPTAREIFRVATSWSINGNAAARPGAGWITVTVCVPAADESSSAMSTDTVYDPAAV
jgi:hypothetical protein